MKKIILYIVAIVLSYNLNAQTLNTNTLLDSICKVPISKIDSTQEIEKSMKEYSSKIFHKKYNGIILSNLFKGFNSDSRILGADSSNIFLFSIDRDIDIISVLQDSSYNYRLLLIYVYDNTFLVSVNHDSKIIDFITYYFTGHTFYHTNPKDRKKESKHDEWITTKFDNSKFIQTHFFESKYLYNNKVFESINNKKIFSIDKNGKFILSK